MASAGPDTAPVHAKAAGLYMICTLAKHKAESEGYDDALMYDYRGFLAEATAPTCSWWSMTRSTPRRLTVSSTALPAVR